MEKRFETFTTTIAKISRNIRKIKSEEVSLIDNELKGPHVSCLYYLFNQGPLTAKELCNVCDEDKAAVSRAVEYLEDNNYIECDSKLEKRYKSLLKLTEKGKIIAKRVYNKVNEVLNFTSLGLTEEKRQLFYENLILISNNLQKYTDNFGV